LSLASGHLVTAASNQDKLVFERDATGPAKNKVGMIMPEVEMRSCLAKLDALQAEIKSIEALFGDRQYLLGHDRQVAQTLLAKLKKRLRDEHRHMSTVSGRAALNPTEKAYYAPAVHGAIAEFSVKTNSAPGAKWLSELYAAAGDINYYASQLRDQLGA
jgi:hypothetical protein